LQGSASFQAQLFSRECKHHKGKMKMKRFLWTIAILAVATAVTAPVFAGLKDAKNKTECEKAGGVWIEKDNKCGVKGQ
jgi:hypothetical protein